MSANSHFLARPDDYTVNLSLFLFLFRLNSSCCFRWWVTQLLFLFVFWLIWILVILLNSTISISTGFRLGRGLYFLVISCSNFATLRLRRLLLFVFSLVSQVFICSTLSGWVGWGVAESTAIEELRPARQEIVIVSSIVESTHRCFGLGS